MEGIIYIIGLIGDCGEEQGIELVDVISQVRSQQEATSFKVLINSQGGNVQTGEDIYHYLRSLKVPITTIGSGMVASIATVIFMAGSTRLITEGCGFRIHYPMGNPQWLTADEMAEYSKMVKEIENKMIKFYSDNTGMQKEAIAPMLRNETDLTPEQLKSFGFTTGDTPLKIAAKASININKNKNKMSEKAENLLEKIWNALDGKKEKKKKKKFVNLILFNAEQGEVDFYELEAGEEVTVGAKAKIDGKDAEGEVVMSDGRVFVFEAGALTEIREAEGKDGMTLEEAMDALDLANAEIVDLTGEKESLTTEVAMLKKDLKSKNKIIDRIKAIQSKFEEDPDESKRKKGTYLAKKKNGLSEAISKLKKYK